MSKLINYHVALTGSQLSDLFFNFEHEERDKLFASNNTIGMDEQEKIDFHKKLNVANLADATAFATCIGMDHDVDFINALVEDFNERI